MLKPKKLCKGDTIGIVGPANYAPESQYRNGIENLKKLGYKIKTGRSCSTSWYNFAGRDQLRADDINEMFHNKNINAVLCLRGGYGSCRIIEYINFDIIKNNPKLFIGYSDITTLHCAFSEVSGLATVHGPMLMSNIADKFDEFTKNSFLNIVEGRADCLSNPPGEEIKVLVQGSCKGAITGGSLTLASDTLGTEYSLNAKGRILFLEDINEYTYKIDKMLCHLKHCNIFNDCEGVILGDFKNCNKEKNGDFDLTEVFSLFFKDYDKPVIYNFKAGHCFPTATLPFGAECKLSAKKNSTLIKILEQVVF
ncbi:MAG: LD-carboxypeptidase [Victivallales bacterium]|nr:LD-carboxypeptidase [Victivallales bacterium]